MTVYLIIFPNKGQKDGTDIANYRMKESLRGKGKAEREIRGQKERDRKRQERVRLLGVPLNVNLVEKLRRWL